MFGFFKKKQPPNDVMHQIAASTTTLLNLQLMLCKSSNKIGDDWTIGYIGGFIDQLNIRKGIKHDERGIGVMLIVFGSIFGDKNRVAIFNRYESLIESNNSAAIEGNRIARNEVVDLLNGARRSGLGLSFYCSGNLDEYLKAMATPPTST